MVTKPLCKVCNERHWGNEPHIWKEARADLRGDAGRPEDVPERISGAESASAKPDVRAPRKASVSSAPVAEPAAKFDRLAYQREYMRKWRAERKLKK